MPKLLYLHLDSSPTFQHPDLLAYLDDCLKSCATDICNVSFDDIGWIQATLPIKMGGIGLRRASDLALPAYLAFISASQSLIFEITQPDNIPHALDSCFDVWSCCCCCRPHSTNVLQAESSIRIKWQPTVSPPRWQGKAPLCRDSSRGPG